MVRLSAYENSLLEGKEGRLKQVCLENILRYAEILGAEELCEITKATGVLRRPQLPERERLR